MTLSENAKLRRNKHARQNWKNKVERRKLESKGQTTANVEEMGQLVPNVNEGVEEFQQGPDYTDFLRRQKIAYIKEEEDKLKRLQEEPKENPGSHPFNEVGEGFCESRINTSISQEDVMTSVKKDPYLRPITEDIYTGGGPTVVMSGSQNRTLSENAKLRRKVHARQNWKNKVKRRKLEAEGQTTTNVEAGGQMVPNVDEGASEFEQGPDDVAFSTVKIRREKVEYSGKEEEKKSLQEESKENPGSHPFDEVIVEENQQQTIAEFCKKENLVLPTDEVGDESRRSTSISQEDLEELMTSVKKDPYLKPILEDIETGGPTVMMRYLNDSEITQKLALAMGFGVLGGHNVNSVEHTAPNADAEDQTAKQA